MKKFLSVFLVLTMTVAMLSGCGKKEAPQTEATTAPAATVEGTLEELLNRVIEERPVEFMGGVTTLDLTDTSEDGQWILKNCTGLDSADRITEAAVFEPMMGSLAFSMVMVRVAPGESTRTVAEAMKSGVDPRKWICVEADDLLVTGCADVVMLIMVSTSGDMTAQSFVDAFQKVVDRELEFTI